MNDPFERLRDLPAAVVPPALSLRVMSRAHANLMLKRRRIARVPELSVAAAAIVVGVAHFAWVVRFLNWMAP
jgi:hypothetical protein